MARGTRKQMWLIDRLIEERGLSRADVDMFSIRKWGVSIDNWHFTREMASNLIDMLQSGHDFAEED